MRIYDYVIIDMTTGETLAQRSAEYAGPVAECKGGGGSGSTTNTVDYAYNNRMATIAEQQQAMAQDYFDFWKSDYKPLEQAQIQANMDTLQQSAPAREKFIQESTNGVNEETLAATARADAAQASSTADSAATRTLARYGINPDSGVFASTLGQSSSVDRARLAVQASNDARTKARTENYNRLAAVAGLGLGG